MLFLLLILLRTNCLVDKGKKFALRVNSKRWSDPTASPPNSVLALSKHTESKSRTRKRQTARSAQSPMSPGWDVAAVLLRALPRTCCARMLLIAPAAPKHAE